MSRQEQIKLSSAERESVEQFRQMIWNDHADDVPLGMAIDRAVELAEKYGEANGRRHAS